MGKRKTLKDHVLLLEVRLSQAQEDIVRLHNERAAEAEGLAEFERESRLVFTDEESPVKIAAAAIQVRSHALGIMLTFPVCLELAAVVVHESPANTTANTGVPNGVTASWLALDDTWRKFTTAPEVSPNTPTGDYQFFLRSNGLTDRVELWRAFLAGRLTA